MSRSNGLSTTYQVVLAAAAAVLLSVSCGGGGGTDRPDQQALAASEKAEVCHYDKDTGTYSTLTLVAQGAAAHVAKHPADYSGACVTCPCFTAAETSNSMSIECDPGLHWGVQTLDGTQYWLYNLIAESPPYFTCGINDNFRRITPAESEQCLRLIEPIACTG